MCMLQFPAKQISGMVVFYHLHGAEKPIAGSRVTWLKRPRGIRYEQLCANLSVSRQAS